MTYVLAEFKPMQHVSSICLARWCNLQELTRGKKYLNLRRAVLTQKYKTLPAEEKNRSVAIDCELFQCDCAL